MTTPLSPPTPTYFLSLCPGGTLVLLGNSEPVAVGLTAVSAALAPLFADGTSILCSSDIDFPEETGADAATIAWCASLRAA